MAEQVKSKQRVADHGEVFTNEREVNAMLDMVKQETERLDSRFLEPACGDGNFLAEILRRKLAVVKQRYGKNPRDWEKYAFVLSEAFTESNSFPTMLPTAASASCRSLKKLGVGQLRPTAIHALWAQSATS